MRIAIDCRSVFDGMGGIGRYCACIVNALARLDGRNEGPNAELGTLS